MSVDTIFLFLLTVAAFLLVADVANIARNLRQLVEGGWRPTTIVLRYPTGREDRFSPADESDKKLRDSLRKAGVPVNAKPPKVRWAKSWLRCRRCKTTKIRHHANGHCNRCYDLWYRGSPSFGA